MMRDRGRRGCRGRRGNDEARRRCGALIQQELTELEDIMDLIGGRPCDNQRLELIRGLLARFASSSSQKMAVGLASD